MDDYFKFNIEKISDSEIKINGFENLGDDDYYETTLLISVFTLHGLIKILSDDEAISHEKPLPVIENEYDRIEFRYLGGEKSFPVLRIGNKNHITQDGIKADNTSIHIPFRHAKTGGTSDWIAPLVEELKKYI